MTRRLNFDHCKEARKLRECHVFQLQHKMQMREQDKQASFFYTSCR
jgi:hypothetical protein